MRMRPTLYILISGKELQKLKLSIPAKSLRNSPHECSKVSTVKFGLVTVQENYSIYNVKKTCGVKN